MGKYGKLFLNCSGYPFLSGALEGYLCKILCCIDTPPCFFSSNLTKGSNFYDFLCDSLDDKAFQKKELLLIERICSSWEQILSFKGSPQ